MRRSVLLTACVAGFCGLLRGAEAADPSTAKLVVDETRYYTAFADACAAVSAGGTIRFLDDCDLGDAVAIGGSVTVNLDGHVLTKLTLGASVEFAEGGTISNGTIAVSAALGANPNGTEDERRKVISVLSGKTLTVENVSVGDQSGHEPFNVFSFPGNSAAVVISGGVWHAASLMSSKMGGNKVEIRGGRFHLRAWYEHSPKGEETYQHGNLVVSGGAFSLAPHNVADGMVILHDPADRETPYHVVPGAEAPYTRDGWTYHYRSEPEALAAVVARRETASGEKLYTSLYDAVRTASAGETVTLVADIPAIDRQIVFPCDLTLDGAGYQVRVAKPFVDETGYVSSDYTLEFYDLFKVDAGRDVVVRNIHVMGGGIITADVTNAGSHAFRNSGTLLLENVTVTRTNGAVLNENAVFRAVNCRFVRNCRYCAGGLYNKGIAVLERSSLSENRSLYREGGGGAVENGGRLYVNNCVFCNNSSTEIGGAINNFSGNSDIRLYLMNTTLAGNFCATQKDAVYGGGVGLRASGHVGSIYAVNVLACDNYHFVWGTTPNKVILSDFSAMDNNGSLQQGKMTNDVAYSVYCAWQSGGSVPEKSVSVFTGNDVIDATESTNNVFKACYASVRTYQNNRKTSTALNAAQLVSKEDASLDAGLARYAPIDPTGRAVTGTKGVYTYFDAGGWKTGRVLMSYATVVGDADLGDCSAQGAMVALGDLEPADRDSLVTNFYERAYGRSFGIAGASGYLEDEDRRYTLRLADEVTGGSVSGITVFGDTYKAGTEITLTATPGFAREFLGWYRVDASGNETLVEGSALPVWTFALTEDLTLMPRFSAPKDILTPTPSVHVRMADDDAGGAKLYPITLTTAWMTGHYDNFAETLAEKTAVSVDAAKAWLTEILEEVDAGTGLKMWQDYVLGIRPGDTDAKIWIDSPQYRSEQRQAIQMKMNVLAPPSGTGFNVRYRLDKKLGAAPAFARGDVNDTGSYAVDAAEIDPLGLYVIDVLFVPEGKTTSEEFVTTVNTAGVLRVENPATRAALAAPWTKLRPSGSASVRAVDLVKTTNLTPDDVLYVYDKANNDYRAWKMLENGNWSPLDVFRIDDYGFVGTTGAGVASEDSAVARGLGLWLERRDPSTPIYLCGQYEAAAVDVTELSAGWNLVGNPSPAPFDLAPIFGKLDAATKDRIVVPTAGAPKTYTYEDGAWGYTTNRVVYEQGGIKIYEAVHVTDDKLIPPGAGFWYISGGGGRLDWTGKTVEE